MPPVPRRLAELRTSDGEPLLGPLVRQAYKWFAEGMVAAFEADAEPPLTMVQVELFANIDLEGTSIAELARRCSVTRQTAHRLVHELVSAEMVELVPDLTSARRKLVRATRRGHQHLLTGQLTLMRLEDRLVERLGEQAVADLRDLLGKGWGEKDRPLLDGEQSLA